MSQGSIRTRGIKKVTLLYNCIKHWQLAAYKQIASLHSKISIFCFTMIWSRALIYSRPGGIPVMPWGDCIHCPPEKHNAQSTTDSIKNTGIYDHWVLPLSYVAQFKHLCWNCLHCVAFRKTLYYTRLNYINTHFIIKNCNSQTLIFPVELSIAAFASLQNPRIKPYTCSI